MSKSVFDILVEIGEYLDSLPDKTEDEGLPVELFLETTTRSNVNDHKDEVQDGSVAVL